MAERFHCDSQCTNKAGFVGAVEMSVISQTPWQIYDSSNVIEIFFYSTLF